TVAHALYIPELPADASCEEAAHALADAGWYVGPIKQGSKHAGSVLGDGWQHKTTRDHKSITALWAGTDYGVFLHAGRSGGLVIDMDHPEKCPDNALDAIVLAAGPFQSSRPDQPGRGHYIFQQPSDRMLGNSEGGWRDCGFEVRGNNG